MNKVKILAPAKINLHLQITSKRKDGYHNLISIFQMVSIFDELVVEYSNHNSSQIIGDFDCAKKDNLIYKAIGCFKKQYKIDQNFKISCKKKIPAGAGLGGGSSDAAATLLALRHLLKLDIEDTNLKRCAEKLGSDVPFFMGTPTALVYGRGEVLIPLQSRTDFCMLISDTGDHSSTKEAFKMLRTGDNKEIIDGNVISDRFLNKEPSEWEFFNSFSNYLFSKNNVFKRIIRILNDNGSNFSSITGTGSSVFGVFCNDISANNAKNVLKNNNITCHKVKMLANRPEPVYN
jgi:4-diphosphocytidyl-2-C-methyl-D-erythritol kinase